MFVVPALPLRFSLTKFSLLGASKNCLARPLAVVESLSYFASSPSGASQDGFKGLIGNVVHFLLGYGHPPCALLPIEVAQPLLEQAGQLESNFACHDFDCLQLASSLLYCQRATDGVRGDPAYVECNAAQIRATPASTSQLDSPPSLPPCTPYPQYTPAPLPGAKPPKKPNPPLPLRPS